MHRENARSLDFQKLLRLLEIGEVIDSEQILQVSSDHSALAVCDDVHFPMAIPPAGKTVRESEELLAAVSTTHLAEVPRLEHALLRVLICGMVRTVDSLDQIMTYVITGKAAFLSNLIDADELLVKLTGSVVDTTERRDVRCIDVRVVAVLAIVEAALYDAFLERIVEVICQQTIRSVAKEPVKHDNWIIVAPGRLRGVAISAIMHLDLLVFV